MRRNHDEDDIASSVWAEVHSLRAEIQAYRAEVAAWRAEAAAIIDKLDRYVTHIDADLKTIVRRLFEATEDLAKTSWETMSNIPPQPPEDWDVRTD